MKKMGIYIHIPFCDHKCIYCDFYSVTKEEHVKKYIDALLIEINTYAKKFTTGFYVPSIFFGGGTPSLISPEYISSIMDKLSSSFSLDSNCEITLETNPGTVEKEKLKDFLSAGVNRLSIGVQSFNDKELKFLTRIHNSETAVKTIEESVQAGFENINLDLIFNLPGQSFENWMSNLKKAVSLPVKHISAYSLILEKGTVLNALVKKNKVKLNSEENDYRFYVETINFLNDKGFLQYEVSNFAKDNFKCKHNLIYWNHDYYLGFGTSAHSFYENKRWWNIRNLSKYIENVDEKGDAKLNEEILSNNELLEEFIMLKLRSGGIPLDKLKVKFNYDLLIKNKKIIDKYISMNFINYEDALIKLTPMGYNFCDRILEEMEI